MVRVTSVEVDDQRVLHVTFDSEVTEKNAKDMIGLFVYCPELRVCMPVPPVLRSAGVAIVELTEELINHKLHLYGLVQDEKRRTSDTIYVDLKKK